MFRLKASLTVALALAPSLAGATEAPAIRDIGDAARGRQTIATVGCGACHTIPGVRGAVGKTAPPLMWMGRRTTIAGMLPNTPSNMFRWLKNPQAIVPGNAMPAGNLSDQQVRDIAAYLESLK